LLANNTADALIRAGLDTLRISLQGISSEKYKKTCNYILDFDELLSNIKYFYKHKNKCNLFIKVLDVALDEDDDKKFFSLFEDICDRMYIEQCRPVYDGVKLTNGMPVIADRYGRVHEKRQVCPLCFYMLGIFPNGDVEPCDTIYKPVVLGNVKEISLIEMWQGAVLKEFQTMQLRKRRIENSKCAICCAPDDVAHPEDVLDDSADEILKRLEAIP